MHGQHILIQCQQVASHVLHDHARSLIKIIDTTDSPMATTATITSTSTSQATMPGLSSSPLNIIPYAVGGAVGGLIVIIMIILVVVVCVLAKRRQRNS